MNSFRNTGNRIPYSNTGTLVASDAIVVIGTGTGRKVGVAVADIAATTGTGEIAVDGIFRITALSTDAGSAGDRVYYDTANTRITVTKSSTTVYAGVLSAAKVNGDLTADVWINAPRGNPLLFAAVAASTAVTNTTTETAFDVSFTIPANVLKVGDKIRINAKVTATATNSTDTLNVKLKIGATTIVATGAVDVANSDTGLISAELTVRTIGAGGTFIADGLNALGVPGTATAKTFDLASTAIDTTATQAITLTATWSVANAGNSCRLDKLDVEHVG